MKKWKKALIALFVSAFAIGAASCKGETPPPANPPGSEQPGPSEKVTVTVQKSHVMGGLVAGYGKVDKDSTVTLTVDVRTGYTFVGWYEGETLLSDQTTYAFTATKDVTITAVFEEIKKTVTFDSQGGSEVTAQKIKNGEQATAPQDPTRFGYDFDGWYLGATEYDFTTPVTEDITLIAKWTEKKFTVSFDADGGSAVAAQQVQEGRTATMPTTPTKLGYNFLGWFKEGAQEAYDFSTAITGNLALKAKWVEAYFAVTFDADNGSAIVTETVDNGTAVLEPTTPTKDGHTFLGWFEEGAQEAYDFTTPVTKALALKARWQINQYTLTVNAGAGGTVNSVGGKYDYNTPVEITATPDEGYKFDKWSDGVTQATRTIKMTRDVTIAAQFVVETKPVVMLSAVDTRNNALSATLTGGGAYEKGAQATIQAGEYEGYTFEGWYLGTQKVSSNFSYTITVEDDVELVAKYEINSYTIMVSTEGQGGVATGGNQYEFGEEAQLTATADADYVFVGWYENGSLVESAATYPFTVTKNRSLTAKFEYKYWHVTLEKEGNGTVSGAGKVVKGERVTLTATPDTNYEFAGWYDGDECIYTGAEYSFKVTQDVALTAKFERIITKHTITLNSENTSYGTVSFVQGAEQSDYGSSVTVQATPKEGYHFVGWYKGGKEVGKNATYTFTVEEDVTLQARFEPNTYVVTANSDNVLGGTVSGGGSYAYGATATIKATRKTGYVFDGWYDLKGTKVFSEEQYSFVVEGPLSLEARWKQLTYVVTFDSDGGDAVAAQTIQEGATISRPAVPTKQGYAFSHWSLQKGGEAYDFSTAVTGATTLYAVWTVNAYTVTVEAVADEGTGGTVSGDGSYAYGETATLTATTNMGYTFLGWYNGETKVSSDLTYKPTITADLSLTAKWQINKYTVTLNSETGGTVSGGGTYNHGVTATITAKAGEGYTFLGWYNGTTKVSGDLTYEPTITADLSLTAKWEKNKCTVTLNSETGGTVTGGGTYDYGTQITLKATTNTGYTFEGWYNGSTKVSGNAEYTFTATETITLTAKWKAQSFAVKANANISAGGTISGVKSYDYGSTATLTATANSGYTFLGWYNGSTLQSPKATYEFTVTQDVTLTAKFSAKIGLMSDYWVCNNSATTTVGSNKVTFKNTQDGDSIFTKSQYTNFTLQYDVTGLRNATYGWLGFICGSETSNPFYGNENLTFVYLTKESWNSVTWYKPGLPKQSGNLDAAALSDKLLTENTVNIKWTVSGGKLSVTLKFADGTTATKTDIPSYTGSTKGYVGIPATLGSNYTISNLELIDLDGRDFNAPATKVTTKVKDLAEAQQIRINGRTHYDSAKDNALVLRNSASGFELYTTSANVAASMSVSQLFEGETMQIKVWVDGVAKVIKLTSTSATSITLASGLSTDKLHHIKVAKMNEALGVGVAHKDNCNIYVHNISYNSTDAPVQIEVNDGKLKLEVYGDSITCGYGALGNVATNPGNFNTAEEDATVTYAYKAAEALGAHINVVAHQGWAIGQSRWGSAETPLTLPAIYDKVSDAHDIAWDFTSYVPDIVIIGLGTNDAVNSGTATVGDNDYSLFCWQYLNFLQELHKKYPNAKFALCYGMMDAPGGPMEHAIATWLITASKTPPAEGYASFPAIAVDLTGADGVYMGGGGSHPSEAQHLVASQNLRNALAAAGWVS